MHSSLFVPKPWAPLVRLCMLACLTSAACCRLGADETRGAAETTHAAASASAASPAPAAPTAEPAAAKPAQGPKPEERQIAGASHILVTYKGAELAAKTVTRSKDAARKRAQEALAKLKAGTPFEQLVKDYSDDPSKAANGAIGNFERNAMPPAFSDATFAMEVGQTSEVVETPRGFHIIRRTK